MNCPLCGEVCRCPLEPLPPALLQRRPDCEPASGSSSVAAFESKPEVGEAIAVEGSDLNLRGDSSATSHPAAETLPEDGDAAAWRDELSARLNRYRARRKVRPPRYPSLSLRFEAPEVPASTNAQSVFSTPEFEPVSNQALALDGMSSHGLPGDHLHPHRINLPSRSASDRESSKLPRLRLRPPRLGESPWKQSSNRKPKSAPESTFLCRARHLAGASWRPWSTE